MTIATLVPILFITALVQFMKEGLGLPSKYAQIAAFGLAVVFGVLFYISSSITETVVAILGYGLAAVGLWEVAGKKYEEARGVAPSIPPASDQKPVDSD